MPLVRSEAANRLAHCANVVRRCSAATAEDVYPPALSKFADHRRHVFGAKIELAHLVRQAGIRMATDPTRRDFLQCLDVWSHRIWAECAVHADREHWEVRNSIPKCFDILA